MTLYLNLRQLTVGGYLVSTPYMLQGDGEDLSSVVGISWDAALAQIHGRNVIFYVHGFNVNYVYGVRSFHRLAPLLHLQPNDIAIGVLWPGDSWIPAIDYPIEGDVAVGAGKLISSICRNNLAAARSFSFASHSLGARVVLQALLGLGRPARSVVLSAGAINQSSLVEEYASAAINTTTLAMLASKGDNVLRLAFPPGDLAADAIDHDHPFGQPALGYDGPSLPEAALVEGPWNIPYFPNQPAGPLQNFDHGDYHPPGDPAIPPPGPSSYASVAAYIANAFYGRPQSWP